MTLAHQLCENSACLNRDTLGRFYDPVTDSSLTLCASCFEHFKQIRRAQGLLVPNVRPLEPMKRRIPT